ncbi:hypothetical protein V8E51_004438 [Hyaloscypha variabilis]
MTRSFSARLILRESTMLGLPMLAAPHPKLAWSLDHSKVNLSATHETPLLTASPEYQRTRNRVVHAACPTTTNSTVVPVSSRHSCRSCHPSAHRFSIQDMLGEGAMTAVPNSKQRGVAVPRSSRDLIMGLHSPVGWEQRARGGLASLPWRELAKGASHLPRHEFGIQSDTHWVWHEQSLHGNKQRLQRTGSVLGRSASKHRRRGRHHSLIQMSSFVSEGGLSSKGQARGEGRLRSTCRTPARLVGRCTAAVRRARARPGPGPGPGQCSIASDRAIGTIDQWIDGHNDIVTVLDAEFQSQISAEARLGANSAGGCW